MNTHNAIQVITRLCPAVVFVAYSATQEKRCPGAVSSAGPKRGTAEEVICSGCLLVGATFRENLAGLDADAALFLVCRFDWRQIYVVKRDRKTFSRSGSNDAPRHFGRNFLTLTLVVADVALRHVYFFGKR